MINTEKINTRKEIVFNLTKAVGIENQKAQVVLCMDISGSMEDMYRNGTVQDVIERIVPVALQFDDNGELDLYMFTTYCKKHKNNVTLKNLDNLVNNELLRHYAFGGTNYAPPINMIIEEVKENTKGGIFSSAKPLKYPVYVIFITDGQNQDTSETETAIREASKHGAFFQFVGIGSAQFPFLEKLDTLDGRFIDNANFFKVKDINAMTDEDLYGKLLGEFPSWLKLAKEKKLIETK